MPDELDLYLTSPDWISFSGSKQLSKIERINIGFGFYLHVTTKDILLIDNNIPVQEFLLTKWYHFVGKGYKENLPTSFDVFIAETKTDGRIRIGKCIARETMLHKKEN